MRHKTEDKPDAARRERVSTPVPTTRYLTSRAVQPMVAGLEALGHPARPLLQAAQIPAKVLHDPDGRIPSPAVAALWDLALNSTRDDCLGIHLAETAPIASFEVHAHALLSSPTLREAYRRGAASTSG